MQKVLSTDHNGTAEAVNNQCSIETPEYLHWGTWVAAHSRFRDPTPIQNLIEIGIRNTSGTFRCKIMRIVVNHSIFCALECFGGNKCGLDEREGLN